MSAVDELITWLRAQMDEDERVAREAAAAGASGSAEHWSAERVEYRHADTGVHDTWVVRGARVATPTLAMCPIDITPRITQHIARWDPARALAEVVAKRQILALHTGEHDCPEIHTGTYPADWPESAPWGKAGENWAHPSGEHFETDQPCPTVQALAQLYAGRDGWREEWQVSAGS